MTFKFLDEIFASMQAVTDAEIEEASTGLAPVDAEKESVIGDLPDALKRLYVVFLNDRMLALIPQGLNDEVRAAYVEELHKWARDWFWYEVRAVVPHHRNLGVRGDWKIVAYEKKDEEVSEEDTLSEVAGILELEKLFVPEQAAEEEEFGHPIFNTRGKVGEA